MKLEIDIPSIIYNDAKENRGYISVGKMEIAWKAIADGKPLEQETILDKLRAEIETKFGHCDLCEYFEDYDYEENDISEYRSVGDVAEILQIIDKYMAEVKK